MKLKLAKEGNTGAPMPGFSLHAETAEEKRQLRAIVDHPINTYLLHASGGGPDGAYLACFTPQPQPKKGWRRTAERLVKLADKHALAIARIHMITKRELGLVPKKGKRK